MSTLKELIRSPHIHIALAAGVSIVVLAYVSKRVLAEPIGSLVLAIPPFLATIFEVARRRFKGSRICTTWYWIVAIFVATGLVILFHMV